MAENEYASVQGRAVLHRLADQLLCRKFEGFRCNVNWRKADGSRVSDIDIGFDREIWEFLAEELPEIYIFSEETPAPLPPPSKGWLALVDPLDGTENFVDGRPDWGISVSLWKDLRHAASLLLFPFFGKKLVSGDHIVPNKYRSKVLALSSGTKLQSIAESYLGIRVIGCASLNAYYVIHGSFAAFRAPPILNAWDIQAAICLATEYGCCVRVNGRLYDLRLLDPHGKYEVEIYTPETRDERFDVYRDRAQ